jgi:small subunit ribosomal protein S16
LGRRHRPFFRLTAVDKRMKRDGRVLEELGFYDPLAKTEEASLNINTERAQYWLSVGAQPSETVRTLLRRKGVEVKRA